MDSSPKFEHDDKRNGQQTLDGRGESERMQTQRFETSGWKLERLETQETGEDDKKISSSLNYACNITGICRHNLLIALLCEKRILFQET